MTTGRLIYIGSLLVVLGILKFAPGLTRRIMLLVMGEEGRAAVGQKALASQPDNITLTPASQPPGTEAAGILKMLHGGGFSPVGSFTVPEMGGLPIHFMVQPGESAVAAVYEHPKAGVWLNLFTRYQDGTSFTFATSRMGGGLDQRPGHPVVREPGLETSAAWGRFLRERRQGPMISFTAEDVPQMFADAYAEAIAWRKQRGLSGEEVQRAGMEKFEK